VLTGDNDVYCPVDDVRGFAASLPDGRLHIVAGTDHYLWRHEREAATVVGAFADEAIADAGAPQP
jgi:pimeloyl-ACP methyl ester carboxylesterase